LVRGGPLKSAVSGKNRSILATVLGWFTNQSSRLSRAMAAMISRMPAKRAVPVLPPGMPEFAVDRETVTGFFKPPIGKSTFHDLVGKGLIVPL